MGDKDVRMATAAMAVGGRAVRPCVVCGRKRARWYCAADEAYLCEACDSSIHAANALALRHERVRLAPNGAPMKMDRRNPPLEFVGNAEGSARKKLKGKLSGNPELNAKPFLPDGGGASQLLEVKVELHSGPSDHFTAEELTGNANVLDSPPICSAPFDSSTSERKAVAESDFSHDFLISDPSDANHVLDPDSCCEGDDGIGMKWMGSGEIISGGDGVSELDFCADQDLSDDEYCLDLTALRGSVSGADEVAYSQSCDVGGSLRGKPFKGTAGNAEWVKADVNMPFNCKLEGWNECDMRQVPSLRLDYADVMNSWSDRGTLWTEDHNPQLVPDNSNSDTFPNFDLGCVPDLSNIGQMSMYGCAGEDTIHANSGREARVSRYREKRRTRLFSKKIRYEVRKLNAERRPRMKGRFVKRSPGRE